MRIDVLFRDANVVNTAAVARFAGISEGEARDRADEIGVARIGASFAWTQAEVQALLDQLEAEETEQGDDGDGGDDGDDPDSDPASDEDE
jgi:hypothetical protein